MKPFLSPMTQCRCRYYLLLLNIHNPIYVCYFTSALVNSPMHYFYTSVRNEALCAKIWSFLLSKLPNGHDTVWPGTAKCLLQFYCTAAVVGSRGYVLPYADKNVNFISNIFLQQNDNAQSGNNSNNGWEGPAPNDIHTEGEKVIKKACIATVGSKLKIFNLKFSALHVFLKVHFGLDASITHISNFIENTIN